MLINNTSKNFEKPDTGLFNAVLADVIDLGLQPSKFGPKPKVRLIWILDAKDTEGTQYRVMTQATASLNEKARLFEIVRDIIGSVPPIPFELENLIGSQNQLLISREKSADGTKDYANVKAIMAAKAGVIVAIPQGFVRAKDKNKQGTAAPATQSAAPASASPTQSPATTAPAAQEADIAF